jgi:O-antigen/teichoic acid export membrane protein
MTGLANFGLGISYERNFFQHTSFEESASLLYSVFGLVVALIVFFGIFTYAFKDVFARWIIGDPTQGGILFVTYAASAALSLKGYFLLFLKNSENAKGHSFYSITENVMITVFSLWMVAGLKAGVIGLAWGQLLGAVVSITVLLVLFVRRMPLAFNGKILRESVLMSIPLIPRLIFKTIGNQFDKYMIGLMSTVGSVGFYSIGQKIANMGFVGMTAFGNVYSPPTYRKMFEAGEKGGEEIGRYLTPYMYVSTLFCFVLALFCEEAIWLLTPPEYHPAVEISMILLLYYGILFFGKQPQLLYKKKTHMISFLSILSIALNIAINIPFIMKWGAIGAAWGTFLAGAASSWISFVVSQRAYEIKWEYGKVIWILGLFLVSVVLLVAMKQFAVGYGIRLVIKLALLGIYLVMGVKGGIVTKERLDLFKGFICRRAEAPA